MRSAEEDQAEMQRIEADQFGQPRRAMAGVLRWLLLLSQQQRDLKARLDALDGGK